jgi:fructose-bisphosphate aldolase class II
MRLALKATIREVVAITPKQFDPREILGPARGAMKDFVRTKMRIFQSSGKANTKYSIDS